MCQYCNHPHPGVREAAALSLAVLEGEDLLDRLLGLLADPDPDVVAAAGLALGKMDDPEDVQTMLEALDRYPMRQWEGLMSALSAAMENQGYGLMPALTASCKRRLTQANRYLLAMDFFTDAAQHPEVELMIDQLRLQNSVAQKGTVQFLGNLSDGDLVQDLIDNLGSTDPGQRENAIELLENIAEPALMEFLLPLWEEDAAVRQQEARRCSGWEAVEEEGVWRFLLETPDPWTQMAAAGAAACLDKAHLLDAMDLERGSLLDQVVGQIRTKRGNVKMAEDGAPLTAMEKITFLKRSPFFTALPLEELFYIAQSVQEESVAAGTAVIQQGMVGDKMYIIVEGKMEVRKFAEDGDQVGNQVAILEAKEVFGDMALLDDEPRSASVIALERAHLLSLKRTSLERILRRYSSIAFNMMRILSQRLREAMD